MSSSPPPIPSFGTPDEEILYWKTRLEEKQLELDELETSFTEFQEFSKQLEEELEQEAGVADRKIADLTSSLARIKIENENLQEKYAYLTRESSTNIHTLQEEIQRKTHLCSELTNDVRRLEQENDSLERRERQATAANQDLADRLDKLIEENVWLQSELDETRSQASEAVQRLKEEMRDLKHELSVQERKVTANTAAEGVDQAPLVSPIAGSPIEPSTPDHPMASPTAPATPTATTTTPVADTPSSPQRESPRTPIVSSTPAPTSKRDSFAPHLLQRPPKSPRFTYQSSPASGVPLPVALPQALGRLTHTEAARMVMDMMGMVKELEERLSAYRHTRTAPPSDPPTTASQDTILSTMPPSPHVPPSPTHGRSRLFTSSPIGGLNINQTATTPDSKPPTHPSSANTTTTAGTPTNKPFTPPTLDLTPAILLNKSITNGVQ